MAKNAVTDWSPTDSLNTDIGSTNIAEGCAPGGINDAIRKLMAQVATYITDALHTIVRVGDAAFKIWLNGTTPRIEFDSNDYLSYDRSGNTLSATIGGATAVTVSATSVLSELTNGFALYAGDPANYGISKSITTTVVKGAGGVALHVSGTNVVYANLAGTNVSTPLTVAGAAGFAGIVTVAPAAANATLNLNAPGGFPYSVINFNTLGGSNAGAITYNYALGAFFDAAGGFTFRDTGGHIFATLSGAAGLNVSGALTIGGAGFGGISGQATFNDAAGVNRSNISWQSGNDFRLTNMTNGSISLYVSAAERLRVTSALVSTPGVIQSGNGGAGAVQLQPGDASNTGLVNFTNGAGTSVGVIQQASAGDINFVNRNAGFGHYFDGAYLTFRKPGNGGVVITNGSAAVTGKVTLTDAAGAASASIGGQAIGQATLYSNTSGHRFDSFVQASGMVDGVSPGSGTTGGLRSRADPSGGPSIIQMTNNAATNEWVSIVADPSGDKVTIIVGHMPVFSIDSSGNVRALGSITANVTP